MRPWRVIGMLAVVSLAGVGCERTPAPPKSVVDAANAPATEPASPRPTTQELLSSEYRKFMLSDMPLSLRAPSSWKFSTAADMQFVEGPSPADQAMIQFTRRDPVANDRVEALMSRLKGEGSGTTPLLKSELRQSGVMRVLERIYTSPPITVPKLDANGVPAMDAQGNPVMSTTTTVHWIVMVFIPVETRWECYELKAIGLTAEHLDADKPLLERIMGSITHEPGAASTAGVPVPKP